MIQLKQLHKTYYVNKQPIQALKDINLTIPQNEIFGVIGKSGVGKSTLLRCVNLLEQPTSGHVIIDDIDLTTLPIRKLREQRHKISMIFQHFNLLESRTTFHNIAWPLELLDKSRREIRKKVQALLELVGLSDRKDHYPSQLSGGQKQRVAIARALATDPTILLCDEATSALDTQSTRTVLNLLKKINQELGLTILLITHELDVVKRICDSVGVLEKGQLVEQGATIEILVNPQHSVTRQLTQKDFDFEWLDQLQHKVSTEKDHNKSLIIRLTFIGKDSDEPFIASLIKNFGVTINILQANIERVHETTIGFTICELSGKNSNVEDALKHIQSTSIKAEVLHHG